MTEKEKMLAGEMYFPGDSELDTERTTCKDLCYDFNMLRPSAYAEQTELLKRILGKTSDSFYITAPFYCDYGYNITVGKNFYANHGLIILDCAKVTFGDNVMIGPDCGFYTAAHPLDAETRNTGVEYAKPITVGDSVWFGGGVRVMPGVSIGSRSVIGAGSVVTRDIPEGVIAAGNPCRIIGFAE